MSKIKIEEIQDTLNPDGWILISDKYENLDNELVFECPEGHRVFSSWRKMRERRICPKCQKNEYNMIDTKVVGKTKGATRILALDQATRVTGWSVYDDNKLIKYGTFETTLDDEMARCHQIKIWLLSMIANWKPDKIGFEDIQFQEEGGGRIMGVTVFQTLAHLQGILMETAFDCGIEFKLCSTNTWRHYCGVKGKTRIDKKRSMQRLVKDWFDISVGEDEADAIGIGKYMTSQTIAAIKTENWE